jgi:hypothetical protein
VAEGARQAAWAARLPPVVSAAEVVPAASVLRQAAEAARQAAWAAARLPPVVSAAGAALAVSALPQVAEVARQAGWAAQLYRAVSAECALRQAAAYRQAASPLAACQV